MGILFNFPIGHLRRNIDLFLFQHQVVYNNMNPENWLHAVKKVMSQLVTTK